MLDGQLSRWGAIAKHIPLMNPRAKVFLLAPSAADYYGDLVQQFPSDHEGTNRVVSTFAAAQALCVANRGDVVLVLPGYTETLTGVLTLSTAGVRYIGIGEGTLKPKITVNAATHGVSISGASVEFENFQFAAPATDAALSMIRISGNGVQVRKILGTGSNSSAAFVNCVRIAQCTDAVIQDVKITTGGKTVTSFLSIEGDNTRLSVGGFYAYGSVSSAGVIDSAGPGGATRNAFFKDMKVAVAGSSKAALTLTHANSYGIAVDCFFAGTNATLSANGAFPASSWRLSNVTLLKQVNASAQGALIPAVDA